MRRLIVLALLITGITVGVPTTSSALPADFVAPPNSITGTVTDENGVPLPGISVNDSNFTVVTTTDAEGQYLIDNLETGFSYTVEANDPTGQHRQATSDPVTVIDTGGVQADIVMQSIVTTSVSGTVTDAGGAPLAGVVVSEPFATGASATTGADGSFTLDGLSSGETYTFDATDPSNFHVRATSDPTTVAADGSTTVNFVLADANVSMSGTVTDPDGNPVDNVQVSLPDYSFVSAFTGPDGRFAVNDLPAGVYTVSFDPRSTRPELRPVDISVTVADGATADASVQLGRSATFDIAVTGGGAPRQADVTVWTSTGFDFPIARRTTDENGNVTVPIANDGSYYLQIDSQDLDFAGEFYPSTVDRAAATRFSIVGEQHVPVDVDLEAAAVIEGTITMPDGSPGDYTQVIGQPAAPTDIFPSFFPCNLPRDTDAPGTYRLGCLHPSVDWIVKGFGNGAADNGYYANSQSAFNATRIAVEPGQTVSGIDLRLKPLSPALTVTGMTQTYFVTGTTTPGVRVYGTGFPADAHALTFDTSNQGFGPNTFVTVTNVVSATEAIVTVRVEPGSVGAVPANRDLYAFTSMGGFSENFNFFTAGDATTNAKVGSISGRVVGPKGVAVRGTTVRVSTTDGQVTRSVSTDAQGRYTIAGLVPGRYRVEFQGTDALSGEYWKDTTDPARATLVTVRAGRTEKAVDAELARRRTVTVVSASPNVVQRDDMSFDLLGTGLLPITGGFRVSVPAPFGNVSMPATSVSDTRLHVTPSPFSLSAGQYDVVVEWTATDGSTLRTTCSQCLKVYGEFFLFSPDQTVVIGETTTLTLGGFGIIDITDVVVDGTGFTVDSFFVDAQGFLTVTVTAAPDATTNPDFFALTITATRADGATAQAFANVQPPF